MFGVSGSSLFSIFSFATTGWCLLLPLDYEEEDLGLDGRDQPVVISEAFTEGSPRFEVPFGLLALIIFTRVNRRPQVAKEPRLLPSLGLSSPSIGRAVFQRFNLFLVQWKESSQAKVRSPKNAHARDGETIIRWMKKIFANE